MENITKALLIAASVLIVIVLISAGVLLINNVSRTTDDAQKIGNSISVATGEAASSALGSIKGTIISKEDFNSFFNNISSKYSTTQQIFDAIRNEQNVKLNDQIELIGYYCKADIGKTKNADIFVGSHSEVINRAPNLLETGRVGLVDDPTSTNSVKKHLKEVYLKLKGADADLNLVKICYLLFLGYDEWGYVNKAVYFGYLEYK